MSVLVLTILNFLVLPGVVNNSQTQLVREERQFPFYSGNVSFHLAKISGESQDSLFLVSDVSGAPLFYLSEINTEVCETKVCFPVLLTLYWDYSGSFLGFSIPQEFPLTKAGHRKFEQIEYFQLYTLLNNPNSKLGKLKKKDLVKHNNTSSSGADAISGATISVSNETMVSGAAFTCFTLWNKVDSVCQILRRNLNRNFSSSDVNEKLRKINELPPSELALILKTAEEKKFLNKFSVQLELTSNLDSLSPLQCLIINNYLRRQKFLYPETIKNLRNSRKMEECFSIMTKERER